MTLRMLEAGTAVCDRFLDGLTRRRLGSAGSVDRDVAAIIERVRRGGDRALISYTRQFDGVRLTPANLRVTPANWLARSQRSHARSPCARTRRPPHH